MLAAWRRQFKDDPSMTLVARLYDQCKLAQNDRASADRRAIENVNLGIGLDVEYVEKRRKEEEAKRRKDEDKRKAKEEKERRKREEEERKRKASQPRRRKPFNFEEVSLYQVHDRDQECTKRPVGEAPNSYRYRQCLPSR